MGWRVNDYDQQQPITTCIRNTIGDYPWGKGLIKEFLGNADDAGADTFVMLLDKSTYRSAKLVAEGMAEWQGPALCFYNNAMFQDGDWGNFTRKIGDSAKREDQLKTGKFGLGALTAYHFTDAVQVLSNQTLLLLDPHGSYLSMDGQPRKSLLANVFDPNHPDFVDMTEAAHQVEPFVCAARSCKGMARFPPHFLTGGCQSTERFPGTLFRLPLRTPSTASRSKISQHIRNTQDVEQLLSDCMEDAAELLLFTRNVSKIEIWVKSESPGHEPACLLFSCSASFSVSTPIGEDNSSGAVAVPEGMHIREIEIISQRHEQQELPSRKRKAMTETCATWLRCCDSQGGVALLWRNAVDDAVRVLPRISGKIFITLLLPYPPTGLPVHINCPSFAVASNRRELWSGIDDGGKGRANTDLLQNYVGPCYAYLLQHALTYCEKSCGVLGMDDALRLWPPCRSQLHPQAELSVLAESCIATIVRDDLRVAICHADARGPKSVFRSKLEPWKLVHAASQAVYLPKGAVQPNSELHQLICGVLPVPLLPAYAKEVIMAAATSSHITLRLLSPPLLRAALHTAPNNAIRRSHIPSLFPYITSDNALSELHVLPLLPLLDGSMGRVGIPQQQPPYLILSSDTTSQEGRPTSSSATTSAHVSAWRTLLVGDGAGLGYRVIDLEFDSVLLSVGLDGLATLGVRCPEAADIIEAMEKMGQVEDSWLEALWEQVKSVWSGVLPQELHCHKLIRVFGGRRMAPSQIDKQWWISRETALLLGSGLQYDLNSLMEALTAAGYNCCVEMNCDKTVPSLKPCEPRLWTQLNLGQLSTEHQQIILTALVKVHSDMKISIEEVVYQGRQPRKRVTIARSSNFDSLNIFRTVHGRFTNLAGQYIICPTWAWEQQFEKFPPEVLPWKVLSYHSAAVASTSSMLLEGLPKMDECDFMVRKLLPSLKDWLLQSGSKELRDGLVCHLIDRLGTRGMNRLQEINAYPYIPCDQPTPHLRGATTLLDPDNPLFSALYGGPAQDRRHLQLVPDAFYKPEWRSHLKSLGMHERVHGKIAVRCVDRFLNAPEAVKHQIGVQLVKELTEQLEIERVALPELKLKPFILVATDDAIQGGQGGSTDLPVTMPANGSRFATLEEVEDYRFHQFVWSAAPVGHQELSGIVAALKQLVNLDTSLVEHKRRMARHVINLAAMVNSGRNLQLVGGLRNTVTLLYQRLLDTSPATGGPSGIPAVIQELRDKPWVMLSDNKFVEANCICYDLDVPAGNLFPVPSWLQKYKKELIVTLGAIDSYSGAPIIRFPEATDLAASLLCQQFDNPDAYPDFVVKAEGKDICLHRMVIGPQCPPLAARWNGLFEDSCTPLDLNTNSPCQDCTNTISYQAARVFFNYFYTGRVQYKDERQLEIEDEGAEKLALDLLVLADCYDVPFVSQWSQAFLSKMVAVPDNVCQVLLIASHHKADELVEYCMYRAASCLAAVQLNPWYQKLPESVRTKLEDAAASNQTLRKSQDVGE